MVKRRSKNSKLKQKGGNLKYNAQGIPVVPDNYVKVLPPQPKGPPSDAMGPGQWIWQAYNPTGFGSAMGRFADSSDRAIKNASGGRKLQWFYSFGLFIFIISYLGITERAIFSGVDVSPAFLFGFVLTLLVFFLPSIMKAYYKMSTDEQTGKKTQYKGLLGKLLWFFTSPYPFVLLLMVSIGIAAGQITGFMKTSGASKVRNVLHNKMSGTWRGLWMTNIMSVLVFLWFMFAYPFPTEIKDSKSGRMVPIYDNVHAKGIMFNLLLLSFFFTIYFVVEFQTKFNVQ
ncbi:hypothetical protein OAA99_02325 [Omnitrophica bacterium]|nr:hypothetical protein [Candidatus Omnitrophota bacterium]